MVKKLKKEEEEEEMKKNTTGIRKCHLCKLFFESQYSGSEVSGMV